MICLGENEYLFKNQAGKKYKTIYADPLDNRTGGWKIKRGADKHYQLMKTEDIVNLPIDEIARCKLSPVSVGYK